MVRTAFVFAGGGSFGAIQVGMLQALLEHGLTADFVVGSSVGAINGAYFAGDPTISGVFQLEKLWRGIRRKDIFSVNWRTAVSFLKRSDFLLSSSGLRTLIDMHLPYRRLEDAKIPVYIVATNLLSGSTVILSKGSATDAIIASTAIPGAFGPVFIDGRFLVDGAISSNTPITAAVTLGARRLIVLPTGSACALDNPPKGTIANALHALTLLIARQLVSELEGLDESIDFAIVPTQCPRPGSAYDFSRGAQLIADSAQLARRWIAEGGLNRREIPESLRAHEHAHSVIGSTRGDGYLAGKRDGNGAAIELQKAFRPLPATIKTQIAGKTPEHRSATVDSRALWNR